MRIILGAAAAAAVTVATFASTAPSVAQVPRSSVAHHTRVTALRTGVRHGTLSRQGKGVDRLCAAAHLSCTVQGVSVRRGSHQLLTTKVPIGWGAVGLERAYGLKGSRQGHGTIAIIDAGADPKVGSDLRVYRHRYGLQPCGKPSKCLRVHNWLGGPPQKPATSAFGRSVEEEVGVETSLDMDMASAACPHCRLIELQLPWQAALLHAKASNENRAVLKFARAVRTARRLGATSVSLSYGIPSDKYDNHGLPARLIRQRGMPVSASSGDDAFTGHAARWPQDLPSVMSVGGTSLTETGAGFAQSAWNQAGSSCSPGLHPAFGQPRRISRACGGHRASTDVSAVADPYTGVAVYDTYVPSSHTPYRWITVGGTSVASPFVSGMVSRAGNLKGEIGPSRVYHKSSSVFYDVRYGANQPRGVCRALHIGPRVCTAGPGWDGPTGRGTPIGLGTFN